MMVCDIEEKMPPDEVVYWVAYFEIKERKMKDEQKKQKANNTSSPKSKRHK